MSINPDRKSRILNVILCICLILWMVTTIVLILPAWRNYRNIRAGELRQKALLDAEKLERQQQLERRRRLMNSPAEIEKVARETFKYVGKGEVVMSYPRENKNPQVNGEKKSKK